MTKKTLLVALALLFPSAPSLHAQDKLARIIPLLYGPNGLFVSSDVATLDGRTTHVAHFNNSFQKNFAPFNNAFASQIALVNLPSFASGFTYVFDPSLGVFSKNTDSFGPILSERAETIGRNQAAVGFSFQLFAYDTLDNVGLNGVPVAFLHDNATAGPTSDVVTTTNSIQADFSHFTAFLNYGLSDTVDVSVALPIARVSLRASSVAQIQRLGTTNPAIHYFRPPGTTGFGTTGTFAKSGTATGLGDISLRVKGVAFRQGPSRLALGAEVRLPTGDEENLLGSGAAGFKPFLAWSRAGRPMSPHAKVAYEINGRSLLAGDVLAGTKGKLPNQLYFEAGVDAAVSRKLTVAVEVVGRRVLNGSQLAVGTFTAVDTRKTSFPSVTFSRGSFNIVDGALGFKANPAGALLVDLSVRFKLNDSGLRDKVTPLLAFEYGF